LFLLISICICDNYSVRYNNKSNSIRNTINDHTWISTKNLTLNPRLYSIDLDGYIFNASVILLSYLWSLQLSNQSEIQYSVNHFYRIEHINLWFKWEIVEILPFNQLVIYLFKSMIVITQWLLLGKFNFLSSILQYMYKCFLIYCSMDAI
jgi:hypothetical protein